MPKRDYAIDVFRGIGILFVVLGHCIGDTAQPLNKMILSFHMPLFFFCSGMLAKGTYSWGYWQYCKKKLFHLLKAQLALLSIGIGYDVIVKCLIFNWMNISEVDVVGYLTTWFLIVLFYVSIIFPLIEKIISKIGQPVIGHTMVLLCLMVVMLIINGKSNEMLFHIDKVPAALLFYELGYLFNNKKFRQRAITFTEKYLCLLLPLQVWLTSANSSVKMYMNDYGNIFLFVMGALIGIIIILLGANKL